LDFADLPPTEKAHGVIFIENAWVFAATTISIKYPSPDYFVLLVDFE